MNRQIPYPGALPRSADFAQAQQSAGIAVGWLGQTVLGTTSTASGLVAAPTAPASMSLVVGPGTLSLLTVLEQTAFGSALAPDTTDPLLKFGINIAATSLSFTAPTTPGQSQVILIYGEFLEVDGSPAVLPFYNASNPTVQWSGQGGNNQPLNTQRAQIVTISTVAGAPANTGSQAAPSTPAGASPLYLVTLRYGQTSILSTDVVLAPGNPFLTYTLTQLQGLPAQIAALQAASSGSQTALGYVPANSAGDTNLNPTFKGAAVTVTVGNGGTGKLVAGAITGATLGVGAATIGTTTALGSLSVVGGTSLSGLLNVVNGLASIATAGGDSTMVLTSTSAGQAVLGFNCSNSAGGAAYGLKMGLTPDGTFRLGGWSDGASGYRMTIDSLGNASFRKSVTAPTITSNGALNSLGAMVTTGDLYIQSAAAGVDRHVIFRDNTGAATGYVYQSANSAALNTIYISGRSDGGNAVAVDPSGNLTAPGSIYCGGQLATGAGLTVNGLNGINCAYAMDSGSVATGPITATTITATGALTAANLALTTGGITLEGGRGQVIFNPSGYVSGVAQTELWCGTSLLFVDQNSGVFSRSGSTAARVIIADPSAMRLKEAIVPLEDALAVIAALPVHEYQYTEESGLSDGGRRHVGMMAEDVAEHLPQAHEVVVCTDDDGTVHETPQIKLHKFVPHLWRGMQQLLAANEEMRAENAGMRAINAEMRTRLAALEGRASS